MTSQWPLSGKYLVNLRLEEVRADETVTFADVLVEGGLGVHINWRFAARTGGGQ